MIDRRFYLLATLSSFLIAFLYLYYFFDLTIISLEINDYAIGALLLATVTFLTYLCLRVKDSKEAGLLAFQISLFAIFVRAIPVLRLYYQIFPDSHAYFIPAMNVVENKTLEFGPAMASWWDLSRLTYWPFIHLVTGSAAQISSVDLMWFLRWQEPLLGGLFALTLFGVAKIVSGRNSVALISALIGSTGATVVFYQSEYHPQGLAVVLFGLFFYAYLKSRTFHSYAMRAIVMLFVAAFIFSHHFSSIFIAVLSAGFLALAMVIRFLPAKLGSTGKVAAALNEDYDLFILITVGSAFYHFMVRPAVITEWLYALKVVAPGETPLFTSPASASSYDIPFIITFLTRMKWGILILAALYLIRMARRPQPQELRLFLFMVSILTAGIAGNYIVFGPIDRMIAFYSPIVAVFAALAVYMMSDTKRKFLSSFLVQKGLLAVVAFFVVADILTAFSPAFFFQNSAPNPYMAFSNRPPIARQYVKAGEWLREFTGQPSFGTEYDTLTVVFFYARKNFSQSNNQMSRAFSFDYGIINPKIPYPGRNYDPKDLEIKTWPVYSNGEIVVYAKAVS